MSTRNLPRFLPTTEHRDEGGFKLSVIQQDALRHVSIAQPQFGQRIGHEASWRMRRRGSKIKHAHKYLVESITHRSFRLERRHQRGEHHLTVVVKRDKKQGMLITECIIQTASSNPQSLDQLLNRRCFISLAPKQLRGTINHRSRVKCFDAGHLIHLLIKRIAYSGTIGQILAENKSTTC